MSINWSRLASHVQLPSIFFQNPLLAVCFPVAMGGFIGYQSGTRAKQIYGTEYPLDKRDLKQPPGKPPAAVFGPTWTLIYAATGYASYLAAANPLARTLYTTSLLFNFAWTPLFFGSGHPGFALFDITALWLNIALLIPQWNKVDKRAGLIGIGYLTWVSFATYLNSGIWYLNYSNAAKRRRAE